MLDRALNIVERGDSAEYMAELLMDPDYKTWNMFESLVSDVLMVAKNIEKV